MNKLFDKRELLFSVCVIAVYSVQYTFAEKLSVHLGITSSVTATLNLGLSFVLVMWIHREDLYEYYGLCKAKENGKKVLFYIPLLIMSTRNFWHGFALNLPVIDTVFYIANMLTVGFLEELLFRGLLFKAIEKRSAKSAFIISSLTFGLGHIVHLFDGSGMTLVANFCQVLGAFGVGFVFAAVFYSAGSLIPCIVTHSLYDAFSAFANEAGLTVWFRIITSIVIVVISVLYGSYLLKMKNKSKPVSESDGRSLSGVFRSYR